MRNDADDSPIETNLIRVRGHVQGVGFRFACVRQAHQLGITGWVRNMEDGSVQALIQGKINQIDAMLSWLHIGPPSATVSDVVIESDAYHEKSYQYFQQI